VVEMEAGDDLVRLCPHPELGFSTYQSIRPSASPSSRTLSLGSHVELSAAEADAVVRFAASSLSRLCPLVRQSDILGSRLLPPILGGHCLSATVDKLLSKIAAKTEIPVSAPPSPHPSPETLPHSSQGLYLCGRDVTVAGVSGDLMGALSAVTAVLGYSSAELRAERNIVTDLEQTAALVDRG
jgi:hypothetical protein